MQNINAQDTKQVLKQPQNTVKKDSLPSVEIDSLSIKKNDSILKKKEPLEFKVIHNAEDYQTQDIINKRLILYNKAHVTYGDIDLKAGKIIVDYQKKNIFATGIIDSTGYVQQPIFKQGNEETQQDSILFNIETKRALVYGITTKQGEMFIRGDVSKRANDSTIFVKNTRFTTSDKKNPDYYIFSKRTKIIPNKKIIVGGSYLVLVDVPTPVYLPFAYFPLTEKRTSGFIMPSWGQNQYGFSLQNGGYYFALNDYFDLTTVGDLYTNGSWTLSASTNYNVRYKYNGNFSFRYQNQINSIIGFNDYSKRTIYNLNWSHNQDTKSSPNSKLSASVNLGSSKFYQNSLSQIDQSRFLENTMNSSISYFKKFVGTPFDININLSHQQNSKTGLITMTLPSFTLGVEPINPFEGKNGERNTAIQRISLNYGGQGSNTVNTNEDDFLTSKMFKNSKKGIKHTVSLGTNLKVLKHLNLTPSLNYDEIWLFDKFKKDKISVQRDTINKDTIVKNTLKGFYRLNSYNFSLSTSTNLYGNFNLNMGRLKKIRHTISPSLVWTYNPDSGSRYLEEIEDLKNPNNTNTYNPFEGALYSAPNTSLSNSVSVTINNLIEAKVAPKDPDSDQEDQKITLIKNLSLRQSYNFAADSIKFSDLSVTAGTSLFKNKLSINFNGSFSPYQLNEKGYKINKFNKAIYRFQRGSINAKYSLSSKDFDKKSKEDSNTNNTSSSEIYQVNTSSTPTNGFANKIPEKSRKKSTKESELYDASIPWDISLGYTINYNNENKNSGIQSHTLMFDGSVQITPKWNITYRSGYDIKNKDFTHTSFDFSRDLDSWRLNFSWVPFGPRSSYNFFIGVKSSLLSDLKWKKDKPADRRYN